MWYNLLACKPAEVKRKPDFLVAERFNLMVQSEESKSNPCEGKGDQIRLAKVRDVAYHSTDS